MVNPLANTDELCDRAGERQRTVGRSCDAALLYCSTRIALMVQELGPT